MSAVSKRPQQSANISNFQQIKSAVSNKKSTVSKLKSVVSDSAVKGGGAFLLESFLTVTGNLNKLK